MIMLLMLNMKKLKINKKFINRGERINMSKDLYSILGIEKGANEQEIKRAYRRLPVKITQM